jgi:hypothetical protein
MSTPSPKRALETENAPKGPDCCCFRSMLALTETQSFQFPRKEK